MAESGPVSGIGPVPAPPADPRRRAPDRRPPRPAPPGEGRGEAGGEGAPAEEGKGQHVDVRA